MRRKDIRAVVDEKLEAERTAAASIATELASKGMPLNNEGIRDFFPHYRKKWGRSWSNLVHGVSVATQVVWGLPATFDLFPENAHAFERRYGIAMNAAIALSREGRLLPSLYVRDSAAWEGQNDMLELVQLSTANGVRVDAYLNARFPHYADCRANRQAMAESVLRNLRKHNAGSFSDVCRQLSAAAGSAARVMGTRWAYLDLFAPDASAVFQELIERQEWELAFDYLTAVQHLTVSQISGALGGFFVWSNANLHTLRRVLTKGLAERSQATSSIGSGVGSDTRSERDMEIAAFLASRLGGAGALQFLDCRTASSLVKISTDKVFAALRDQLHAAAASLPIAVRRGERLEEAVRQWVDATEEMRSRLKKYETAGGITLTALGSLGCLLNEWRAVGVGVCFAICTQLGPRLGQQLHRLMHPGHHRFIMTMDKIEEFGRRSV